MALKCYDVAREEYDVGNRRQVSIDMRTATNSQTVSIQVSINLTFFRSSNHGYGIHAEVNVVSKGSAITGVVLAHVLEIA